MSTATEQALGAAHENFKRRQFEAYAQEFFLRWSPQDQHEAARFHAEFYSLIQRMYAEAMEPLNKTIADILAVHMSRSVIAI